MNTHTHSTHTSRRTHAHAHSPHVCAHTSTHSPRNTNQTHSHVTSHGNASNARIITTSHRPRSEPSAAISIWLGSTGLLTWSSTYHTRAHTRSRTRSARMHTCSLRRSTLHFVDFRQMSCLKRDPRTQLARLAGTHAGTQARRHAHASMQARKHAATHVQTARGRTHARANARTLARMHHVHVYARVTAQSEQIPTGTYRQEPFATATGAKQTPTGTASSGAPPQTLCGGTPGAFRRTAGLAATDDGSRSIAGHDEAWGLFSTSWLTRTTTQTTGCPARRPNGYKVRIMQVFRPSRRMPFAIAPCRSTLSSRPAIRRHKGCASQNGQKNGSFGLLFIVKKFVAV